MIGNFQHKIPLGKALSYVLLSVLVIWGTLSLTCLYHSYTLKKRQNDPRYTITAIVQTSRAESLPSRQLAELLDLSVNNPRNLYEFDEKGAEALLKSCPVIKRADVRKIKPGTVYVDYETRKAKASIADYDNMASDSDGFFFQVTPFFSPKRLPEVFLGLSQNSEEMHLPHKSAELDLAFTVIDFVEAHFPPTMRLVRVDTHAAFAQSMGQREVVAIFEESSRRSFLRVRSSDVEESLHHFLALQPNIKDLFKTEKVVVDLRCPSIALVKS